MPWGVPRIGGPTAVSSGNLTLAEPASTAQGDLLIACMAIRSTVGFTNADWTKVDEELTGNTIGTTNGTASAQMWACIRGASAPTLTFSRTGGDMALGRIIGYPGALGAASVAAILDSFSSNTTAAGVTTATTGTITTAEAGELIVAMAAMGDAGSFSAFDAATDPATGSGAATDTTTAPTAGTWLRRATSNSTTGPDATLAIADAIRATAGATGTIQATASLVGGHAMIAAAFKLPVVAGGPTFGIRGFIG